VSTACLDWQRRIVAGESLIPPPLYPEEADAALAVFNELRVVDVPGCPTMREACRPWIPDVVGSVFGAYNSVTGEREIKEWLLSVSKKNFKSGLAAGIMLTALILNWRESAEFAILAPTVEVANNSFYPARDMIRKDPELSQLFHVQDHTRTITHRVTKATLKVIAADSEAVGGKKLTGVLIDELWLFGKKPNAADMLREATGGLTSRPEGFVIYLTTMSNEAPAGVFRQKLLYARKVRDGAIDDAKFVPVLYEFPPGMIAANDHLLPENFHITNPNIGASVSRDHLERELKKAQEAGAEDLVGFMAKHLNVEIGLALASDRWAGADHWLACADPAMASLDYIAEVSDVLCVGIDGGGLDDLLGLAVMGRHEKTRQKLLWSRAWAHPSVLERRKSEAARLRDFAADGDLILPKRIGDDVDNVANIIKAVYDTGKLYKIGVDPHGLGGILDGLMAQEIPEDMIVGISQGWKLTGAIKTLERWLAEGACSHSGAPMMAWCVGNAKVEPRGNAITITKQAAGFAKIDPLMAAFNAVSLMALNPEGHGKSFWEVAA
jgi:phage terminase large subunit-like protein